MANKKDIKNRIRSVQNTQKITKSMKLISTIKLKQLQNLNNASRAYNQQISQLLAKTITQVQSEFLDEQTLPVLLQSRKKISNVCLIINSSDRGLCGPYNSQLLKLAQSRIDELKQEGKQIKLIVLGSKAIAFARKNLADCEVIQSYTGLPVAPTEQLAHEIFQVIETQQAEGKIDSLEIIYGRFISMIKSQPTLLKLLPFDSKAHVSHEEIQANKKHALLEFEPTAVAILSKLLPLYCQNQIFQAMVNGRASELANRVTAMGAATDNAKVLIEQLTLSFNKARQAAITQEISEIVAGAESVK